MTPEEQSARKCIAIAMSEVRRFIALANEKEGRDAAIFETKALTAQRIALLIADEFHLPHDGLRLLYLGTNVEYVKESGGGK